MVLCFFNETARLFVFCFLFFGGVADKHLPPYLQQGYDIDIQLVDVVVLQRCSKIQK